VNGDVITRHELGEKVALAARQLKKQGTPLPAPEVLEKQMLERMISDMLQTQFAKDAGVRVEDAQLDLAINVLRSRIILLTWPASESNWKRMEWITKIP